MKFHLSPTWLFSLAKTGFYLALFFLLTITSLALITNKLPGSPFKIYNISTGSMSPALPIHTLIFTRPQSHYSLGDVITFTPNPDRPDLSVTHRIVRITKADNSQFFTTQGDANSTDDANSLTSDHIVGKVAFSLPFLGLPANLVQTQLGFTLLIVVPATIILYSETQKLLTDIGAYLTSRRHRRRNQGNVLRYLKSVKALALFVALGLLSQPATGAYFISQSVVNQNSLATAAFVTASLFANSDTTQAGFSLDQAQGYDHIDYQLRYTQGSPPVEEMLTGSLAKDSSQDSFTHQGLNLGTCSGIVCNYHTDPQDLTLSLNLSGPSVPTLQIQTSL